MDDCGCTACVKPRTIDDVWNDINFYENAKYLAGDKDYEGISEIIEALYLELEHLTGHREDR